MALFETKNITLGLSTLDIIEHSDRFWSSAEPYIVPIFFKIDGDRYVAKLSFYDTQPPRQGTTEVTETTAIQFSVDSDPEDNPFIFTPNRDLLGRGSFDGGDSVDVSDISFTTDLKPIPFTINLFGIAGLGDILSTLTDLIVESEGVESLNTTILTLNYALAELLGLDETFESCPPIQDEAEEFVNNIEAQFNCLIPGTVGGIFALMENDNFSESDTQNLQDSMQEEVESVINDTINSITRVNPIPEDPEDRIDNDEITSNIMDDLLPVIGTKIGITFGAVLAVAFVSLPLAFLGLIVGLAYWIGGPDDFIGVHTESFNHTNIETDDFSSLPINGDDNVWRVNGFIRIND